MAKKNHNNLLWFAGGFIIAYVLHTQIQGVVGQIKGTIGMRSRAYHVTPRAGSPGWQRTGFPGQGHAYGRTRNPYYV